MVKTTEDILGINPLERIDRLEEISIEKKNTIASKKKELEEFEKRKKIELDELEQKKRKELEEFEKNKQKELDGIVVKRKELADLESAKVKEIEETQELIERSFQELMRHKRILIQEEEDIIKKNKSKNSEKEIKEKEMNLESVANTASMVPDNNINYGKFFENLQAPQRLYDITNNQFYSRLTNLRDKASSGEITPEEERFIESLKNKFEQFSNNQSYLEKDVNQYVQRSMNIVEQIGKYQRLKID
jgi:hypothetical protein